jgi:hypothetical protein
MSEEISILRLMDGSTVVGRVTVSPDIIEIEHPIELVFNTTPIRGVIGEQVSLKPWMAIAEDQIFVVDRSNVITIGSLQEAFYPGYERMVETIYFDNPQWQIPEEPAELPEDLDIDLLTDYADAVIKKKIH